MSGTGLDGSGVVGTGESSSVFVNSIMSDT